MKKRNSLVAAMTRRHPRKEVMRHRSDRRPKDARRVRSDMAG
jgi:hypothetical protein